jgi:peroxiredoxin-like protein
MEPTIQQTPPKLKYKTFTYRTQITWLGSRAGMIKSEGKPEFRVASPPEFKGEAGIWTPEDLLVAAVDSCTMTTFAAFSQRLNLPVLSYSSKAEGILEFVDGRYQFTKIILRPSIFVETPDAVAQVEKTIHNAHESCFVANSIKAEVVIEPVIEAVARN